MLQLIYIVAFTVLALLAMANLIRSLLTLGIESQRQFSPPRVTHPELLDSDGHVIDEPLLVMRSLSVEDARAQLDAIYRESPSYGDDARGETQA
ncbi:MULTISPECIES: DUF2973 domain-containing protein [unclassified Thermosynechococcus]|uniref:DUF2973 domain-containing protein n=1 Tax=unclassified Thermosynechococcus TaxID=2622553 RepID=UPI00122DCBA5|nr:MULTISPECIES: DUF2973 domain-containing protein [unclassified Thermosynechococcus]MDR5639851.1 DUF2973 domain-containing protein [Thermosynechococcus sp. PP42]MDR7897638.1 DUF2973 domain-containing protein [Thermosynechococcus sp. JY1332]MDR7905036.1 DUF2973 domain-containing protein [Thermosynechococcus sp. JY1334]MDR7922010.1 DUF2973 domain-containing protein [Thermosynechococcus sp. HY213]MDR7992863.1 DUF2973 domain-containing protein [Thermosynechococcus sp. TG252]